MNKLFIILAISLTVVSCQIEHLTPEEVIEAPTWTETEGTTEPVVINTPCEALLIHNIVRFNNSNLSLLSTNVNPPGLSAPVSGNNYAVEVSLSNSKSLEIFFNAEPSTGIYTTTTGSIGTTDAYIRIFSSGSYYTGLTGAEVYVEKSTDSIRVSYCDIDYNGPININNSRGRFTYAQ